MFRTVVSEIGTGSTGTVYDLYLTAKKSSFSIRQSCEMGIDFYSHPVSPPSRMVFLLAKYLNVPLNLKTVDLKKGEHLKQEFLAINPQHTVPVMIDDGLVLTESRAMLMYLQNRYGQDGFNYRKPEGGMRLAVMDCFYPKNARQRAVIDNRILFDVSKLYPSFRDAYYPVWFENKELDPAKVEKLNEVLGFVENDMLKDGAYIAGGDLTLADFSAAVILSTVLAIHDNPKFPKIDSYLERCKRKMEGWEELNQKGVEIFKSWYEEAANKQK